MKKALWIRVLLCSTGLSLSTGQAETAPSTTAAVTASPCERLYNAKSHAEALTVCQPLAEDGDRMAQYVMGLLYKDGTVVPGLPTTAVKWFLLSAEQGYAAAQYEIGLAYIKKYGLSFPDTVKGMDWLTRSADQSYAPAEAFLAVQYLGQQDYEKAAVYTQRAACRNDLVAQKNLSHMLRNGLGVIKSCSKAAWWAKKAAARDNGARNTFLELIKDPNCLPDSDYNPCGG